MSEQQLQIPDVETIRGWLRPSLAKQIEDQGIALDSPGIVLAYREGLAEGLRPRVLTAAAIDRARTPRADAPRVASTSSTFRESVADAITRQYHSTYPALAQEP